MTRICKRAQHAGDVRQRAVFASPLGDALTGSAFEIGDDEIVALQQHLAQMVVAVAGRQALRSSALIGSGAKAGSELAAASAACSSAVRVARVFMRARCSPCASAGGVTRSSRKRTR